MTTSMISKASLCIVLGLAACSSGSSSSGGSGGTLSGLIDGGFGPNCTPPSNYIGNNLNIGAYCTKGGGQCNAYKDLFCATDLSSGSGNFCLSIACSTDADCGEYACCTGNAGTVQRGCVPVQCDIDDGGTTCPPGD